MALANGFEAGDFEVEIKWKARMNMAGLISDGVLTAADYPEIKGGLMEFRIIMDQVFAQFNTDVGVAGITAITGSSWSEVRDEVHANFLLVDSAIND